jgi:rhodanese-related sulfurtransferase
VQRLRKELDLNFEDPNKPVVFYCGNGYRSSLAMLFAHLLGHEAVNFSDGW